MSEPFLIDGTEHDRDDPECAECWQGFPAPCDCGGLVHAQFFDTNYDDDIFLSYRCSRCGSDFAFDA